MILKSSFRGVVITIFFLLISHEWAQCGHAISPVYLSKVMFKRKTRQDSSVLLLVKLRHENVPWFLFQKTPEWSGEGGFLPPPPPSFIFCSCPNFFTAIIENLIKNQQKCLLCRLHINTVGICLIRYHRIKRRAEKRAAAKKSVEDLQKEEPEKAKEELEKADRLRIMVELYINCTAYTI